MRFAAAIVGFLLGVLSYSLYDLSLPYVALAFFLATLFFFLYWTRKKQVFALACAFFVTFSFGLVRVELAPRSLPEEFSSYIGTEVELTGVVTTDPDVRETGTYLTVLVREGEAETRILAKIPPLTDVSYGERVRISGKLEVPEPFDTDGDRVFRYDRYLAKDGVFAVMHRTSVEVLGPREGGIDHFVGALYDAKRAFMRALDAAIPEPESALASGILVGGKQGLGKELLAAFTVTGLVQLVVLSGYNVMIVADWVRKMFGMFLPARAPLGVAGVAVALFVLAAGAGAAALRAGAMALVALFARATGRTYDALRALALVVLLMLVQNPLLLAYDPGFELSVVATLGLILLTPLIAPKFSRVPSATLREIVATTLAAQIAVLPILLFLTGNLSLVSIAANVLVAPVIPAAMLLSFVAGLVGLLLPVIAPLSGFPAYLLLAYVLGVAEIGAALPLSHLVLPVFPFSLVLIAYAALGYITYRAHQKR